MASVSSPVSSPGSSRSATWTYWICGLLFLATTINYMDRLTLNDLQGQIRGEFSLNKEQYGRIEFYFGLAFAAGSITWGIVADLVPLRWFYPLMLTLWSLAGCATGFARNYEDLLLTRTLLGFFEAAHWPCALQTTQRLLAADRRTWGNSLLQSGSSVGAILTPLLIMGILHFYPSQWRIPFFVIGLIGAGWAGLWLTSVSKDDLLPLDRAAPDAPPVSSETRGWWIKRIAMLVVMVITINVTWHLIRVWQTPFLEEGRGYSANERRWFQVAYGLMADAGCLAVGWLTVVLTRKGFTRNRARAYGFAICACCTMFTLVTPWLPKGPLLLGAILVVAGGALGLFPCYYAFAQEISSKSQGKVSGILGSVAWVAVSPLHPLFGRYVDETKSYDIAFAVTGCLPMFAAILILLAWRDPPEPVPDE